MLIVRDESTDDLAALAALRAAFSRGINAARMVPSPSPASRNFYARLGFGPAGELNVLRF